MSGSGCPGCLATITARRYRFALRSRCTVKQAKVRSFVTPYCEMRSVAACRQHISRVTTDAQGTPGFEMVMIVQIESVRMFRYCAEIARHLSVIFATVFQRYLESTHGDRTELHHTNFGSHLRIVQSNWALLNRAHIE